MRLLLVRLSALGDLIHVLPSYFAVRQSHPGIEIDWLVEDRHAPILRGLDGLTRLVELPRRGRRGGAMRWWSLLRSLRERAYHAAIDFQGLTKSAVWPWLAGIPIRAGYGDEDAREFSRVLYTHRVIPPSDRPHVVDRNRALAESVLGPLPSPAVQLPADGAAEEWAAAWWHEAGLDGRTVAGVNPGTGWESKNWPVEGYAELARALAGGPGIVPLILWGPSERPLAEEIAAGCAGAVQAPPTTVPQLVALARRCSLFVAGDTGPMHIANALGVPTVALFGASDPERNGPYFAPSRVLTHPVSCAPCWDTRCRFGHTDCLRRLPASRVLDACLELLTPGGG